MAGASTGFCGLLDFFRSVSVQFIRNRFRALQSALQGQYPPALHKLISKRKNFAQLEVEQLTRVTVLGACEERSFKNSLPQQDFNRKDGEKSAYTRMVPLLHNPSKREQASAPDSRRLYLA